MLFDNLTRETTEDIAMPNPMIIVKTRNVTGKVKVMAASCFVPRSDT